MENIWLVYSQYCVFDAGKNPQMTLRERNNIKGKRKNYIKRFFKKSGKITMYGRNRFCGYFRLGMYTQRTDVIFSILDLFSIDKKDWDLASHG